MRLIQIPLRWYERFRERFHATCQHSGAAGINKAVQMLSAAIIKLHHVIDIIHAEVFASAETSRIFQIITLISAALAMPVQRLQGFLSAVQDV